MSNYITQLIHQNLVKRLTLPAYNLKYKKDVDDLENVTAYNLKYKKDVDDLENVATDLIKLCCLNYCIL